MFAHGDKRGELRVWHPPVSAPSAAPMILACATSSPIQRRMMPIRSAMGRAAQTFWFRRSRAAFCAISSPEAAVKVKSVEPVRGLRTAMVRTATSSMETPSSNDRPGRLSGALPIVERQIIRRHCSGAAKTLSSHSQASKPVPGTARRWRCDWMTSSKPATSLRTSAFDKACSVSRSDCRRGVVLRRAPSPLPPSANTAVRGGRCWRPCRCRSPRLARFLRMREHVAASRPKMRENATWLRCGTRFAMNRAENCRGVRFSDSAHEENRPH